MFFNNPIKEETSKCNLSVAIKEENSKCGGKLFRPWDATNDKNNQDATITTTSNEAISWEKPLPPAYPAHPPIFPAESFPTTVPASLAQTLGLPHNDALFLDQITQGYAIEEYARVLSQEHQAKLLSAKKQRPKKYKCPHCDVGFSNNGQLKGHIRIHTGERPFKCDEKNCGKTFTRNEELTRHKRIHSGLRPFPCTQCGKRFGRKDHLKKHSRTHMQPRGLYAVPVMLPFDTWTSASASYPYVPMFGY